MNFSDFSQEKIYDAAFKRKSFKKKWETIVCKLAKLLRVKIILLKENENPIILSTGCHCTQMFGFFWLWIFIFNLFKGAQYHNLLKYLSLKKANLWNGNFL